MKTENLFRAERVGDNEIIYGYPSIFQIGADSQRDFWTKDGCLFTVYTNSVCQLIRLEKDRSFFVGDKLEFWMGEWESYEIALGEGEVQECELMPNGVIHGDFGDFELWTLEWAIDAEYQFKIVGNIHEKSK